jgi:hypothetical protein
MKRIVITLCLLALVPTFALGQAATGQASQPPAQRRYAVLEYIKIEPGKGADYRKMEQEVWMPIHRERLKTGVITGWVLWGLGFPGGTAREYDVIAITYFPNLTAVENNYPPEVFTKAHPNMTAAERNARTAPTRRIVRTELVTILDSSIPPPGAQASQAKYLQLNFMKAEPEKAAEYVAFARKYWKPMWQERINQGKMNRWVLAAVRYPAGTGREYNYIGADYFDKVEDLDATIPGLFQKVHPNANQAEFSAQNLALRKHVRVELLRLLEHVQ